VLGTSESISESMQESWKSRIQRAVVAHNIWQTFFISEHAELKLPALALAAGAAALSEVIIGNLMTLI